MVLPETPAAKHPLPGYTSGVTPGNEAPVSPSTIQVDVEPGWRGGQRQVWLLCRGLARKGYPVVLVARRGEELARRARAEGLDVEEIPGRGELDLRSVLRLARIIRDRRPAVVGCHSSRSHGLAAAAKLLLGRSAPPVLVTRRVDFPPRRDPLSRWKYLRAADAFVAISRRVADVLIEAGIPRDGVRVVYSGVEPPRVPDGARQAVIRELGLSPNARIVGTVGSLSDHKGHQYLLEAIPRVTAEAPETCFLIVGDGDLREELEEHARDLALGEEHLRFLGFRPDVPRILGVLDLFVMTSHMEGLCTSIIDANLAGVPVVATRAGGIPELVLDGETGLLAANRNPEDIARKILAVLGDQELGRRLARNAMARAEERFTAEAMIDGYLAVYHELLRR